MKNIRKKRFSFRSNSSPKPKEKWIKHNVRTKAVKDHPELFSLDDEVNQVRDKVRDLEKKIISKPSRDAQSRWRNRDILPMDEPREADRDFNTEDLTLSEKAELRRERMKQVLGTLVFVIISLAIGLWALNFLLARIG